MQLPFTFEDRTTAIGHIRARCGKMYARMADGSIRRLIPRKPYRGPNNERLGKPERRRQIKQRRLNKAAAVKLNPMVQ